MNWAPSHLASRKELQRAKESDEILKAKLEWNNEVMNNSNKIIISGKVTFLWETIWFIRRITS